MPIIGQQLNSQAIYFRQGRRDRASEGVHCAPSPRAK